MKKNSFDRLSQGALLPKLAADDGGCGSTDVHSQAAAKAAADDGSCGCTDVHKQAVERVAAELKSDDVLFDMADMFKALNDPTRLKILNALIISELCVCDLTSLLSLTQPAVSHHLKALRQARLVKFRREGKQAFYSLDDEHIQLLFDQCYTHVMEER